MGRILSSKSGLRKQRFQAESGDRPGQLVVASLFFGVVDYRGFSDTAPVPPENRKDTRRCLIPERTQTDVREERQTRKWKMMLQIRRLVN